jgi:hypothetical protein
LAENENTRQNLKVNTLEHKLINNRIRWYENILRMNKDEIHEKVFITKIRARPI